VKRVQWVLVAPILALVLVSGCTGGRDGMRGGATSVTSSDIKQVARDQLRDGGTLTWPLDEIPSNFNYHELNGTLADNASVISALMPGPFNFDAAAQPSVDRNYFESVELTASDPKQTVTYRINPKAIWYNGTPITVRDFEAQWKALNGTNPAYTVSSTQGYDKIESVTRGRDDREVIVTFAQKYADWQGLFSPLYPASTNGNPRVFNSGWKDKPLTTAGPFKFDNIDQGAKTITLVRNEKWWGAPAKLDRIIFRAMARDPQTDALANGEIDFMDIGPDVNRLSRAQGMQGVALRRAAGPDFNHITINGTGQILQDVQVRRALAMAINRETIAKALIGPLRMNATSLNNHIFMANQTGYQDNSGEVGKHDPAKARQLLDGAGWKQQGDSRVKDGKPLVLRFVIPSQVAASKQIAELVQGMLAEVGMKVTIDTVPNDDFFKKYIIPGNYDVTTFAWLGTALPISSSKSIYAKPKRGADGQLDIQQNFARVGSPEIDQLFDQATAELDPAEARAIANQADAKIWEEVHSLTLYQRPEIVATKQNLVNFGAFGFASVKYEDIGFTK
jgi:peptide/nickel transport system substrate-binding protein